MLDTIFFDLDGLLVDSEPLQFKAYQYAFQQFGFDLELDRWFQWHRIEASVPRWIEQAQLKLDPQAVRAVKKQRYDELIANELMVKPGAVELVRACASEFTIAVVSGSRRESIEQCLQKFDLQQYFSAYISGPELTRSKPYPDPYLEALRVLETAPGRSIALEDSANGLKAAVAAGIACIVCPDRFSPPASNAILDATKVVDSLEALDIETLRLILK